MVEGRAGLQDLLDNGCARTFGEHREFIERLLRFDSRLAGLSGRSAAGKVNADEKRPFRGWFVGLNGQLSFNSD